MHTTDDENFVLENWFLKALEVVAKTNTPPPKPESFKFSTEAASVAHNTQLIRDARNDITSIIKSNQDTSFSYSSKFRLLKLLLSIYKHQTTFPFFSSVHQQMMHYAITRALSNKERITELNANMAWENHRLATNRPDILEEKSNRDVKFGFSISVWASSLRAIAVIIVVQTCGLVVQHTLEGIKYRLTHDLSFSIIGKDASVNSKYDMAAYPEMVYGFSLSRTIHFIVAFRKKFPEERILISKYEFSDA